MIDRENQVISLLVTAVLLTIVIIGTLTLAGHKWPPSPREYPTRYPGIMLKIP